MNHMEAFPIGLPVKDKDGRTGVVVGHRDGKVLVRETGVPTTEDHPPAVALAPEDIAPIHPRPTRYELLAAVEERLMRAALSIPKTLDGQETIARSILTLAQARALL
jgi:hypothetical protein